MNTNKIKLRQGELYAHPIIANNYINNIKELRLFMELHVFAVWDFMSLIKSMQHQMCPSATIWFPTPFVQNGMARLVNDIILAEESDKTPDGRSMSHFDMYLEAMEEVGADTLPIRTFLNNILTIGLDPAIVKLRVTHAPAADFMLNTFQVINSNSLPLIASCFTFGRETAIPDMFQGLVDNLGITRDECPMFVYYLERHIELDGDDHGPKAVELINRLSNNDEAIIKAAEGVALYSIDQRIKFWDGVKESIDTIRVMPVVTNVAVKTTEQVREETEGVLYPAGAVRSYGPRF